jgi:hypothetical protein
MMLAKLAPSVGLAVLAGLASAHDFKSCVTPDHIHTSAVVLSPDPPVHGQTVTIVATLKPDLAITGGKVDLVVTVFGIPVPGSPTFDSCKDLGVSCPTTVGKIYNVSASYGLSSSVPAGIAAEVELKAMDTSGTEFGCIHVDVKVSSAESSSSLFQSMEDGLSELNPFRKLVEAPSALSQLLAAPASTAAEDGRRMLEAAYHDAPEWAGLFRAWQKQHSTVYDSAVAEGQRFSTFMANIKRLQNSRGQPGAQLVAGRHADKTADEMRTFAHFA